MGGAESGDSGNDDENVTENGVYYVSLIHMYLVVACLFCMIFGAQPKLFFLFIQTEKYTQTFVRKLTQILVN